MVGGDRHSAELVMTGRDREPSGDAAVGDRDADRSRHRDRARDAGDDLDVDPGGPARSYLLAAATEDVRVAAHEPDLASTGPRVRGRS